VMILPYLRYVLRTSYVGRTVREPHNIVALGGYQAVQPTITHKLDNRWITNPNHGITPSVKRHHSCIWCSNENCWILQASWRIDCQTHRL
jgi:hypothetical protein